VGFLADLPFAYAVLDPANDLLPSAVKTT
jgi:hypothetical protein